MKETQDIINHSDQPLSAQEESEARSAENLHDHPIARVVQDLVEEFSRDDWGNVMETQDCELIRVRSRCLTPKDMTWRRMGRNKVISIEGHFEAMARDKWKPGP